MTDSLAPLSAHQVIEQYYFELFSQHYPVPLGMVEYSDKPDILIHGDRKIGIELANLHKMDGAKLESEQVQNLRRLKVIELAEQMYLESNGRKIELSIDFDPKHPIIKVEKIAADLAAIAINISTETDGYKSYCAFEATPELRFLFHNGKEYADSKWKLLQSHDVPCLSVERVKELVAQKTKKAANYQPCDAYWLLLIVEFWDPSQDQDITWPVNERVGTTSFERILIYKPSFREVSEVTQ